VELELPGVVGNICQFWLGKFGEWGARVVKIDKTMRKKKWTSAAAALAIGAILAVASVSYAEHTRRWKQSTYEEFLKRERRTE